MPKFEVSVETFWSGAHFLRGKSGPYETLHGHNWYVRVHVACNRRDDLDLVVDFKDVEKELYKVRDFLEHKLLNETPPFDKIQPCCENMAHYYMQELQKVFDTDRTWVSKVKVWETENEVAIVRSDRIA